MKRGLLPFLKTPPIPFLFFAWSATALSIAATFILIGIGYTAWPVYCVYGITVIFFAYTVYTLVHCLRPLKEKIAEKAKRHPFANNLLTSYGFRTVAFSVVSFAVNVGFALFNGVLAILSLSVWYGILACYYLFLSALRGGILAGCYRAKKRAKGDEAAFAVYKLKVYRLCGIALFILELALAAAVSLMILSDRPAAYTEIMAITCAAYTFYKIIFAVINVCKVRRLQDAMLQCFRNINLTDAAVSLLSLQITLVSVFSDGTDSFMKSLNAVTGFAVCALTIVMGVLMIVRATRQLKNQTKTEKESEHG